MKVLISLTLALSINSFSGIEDCIKPKMIELGANNFKDNLDELSKIKTEATQACLNGTSASKSILKNELNHKKYSNNHNSLSRSQCIKSKLNEMGASNYKGDFQKISELKNLATAECLSLGSKNITNSERTGVHSNTLSVNNFKTQRFENSTHTREISSSNNSLERSKCIKNKLNELGAHKLKGDFLAISKLKNQATAECMGLNTANITNSDRTGLSVSETNNFERIEYQDKNEDVIQATDPEGLDYSQDTPQLNWEYQNQISDKDNHGDTRGISSLPSANHVSRNFAKCVQTEMRNLGAKNFVGDAQKIYEIKGQATQKCMK